MAPETVRVPPAPFMVSVPAPSRMAEIVAVPVPVIEAAVSLPVVPVIEPAEMVTAPTALLKVDRASVPPLTVTAPVAGRELARPRANVPAVTVVPPV